MTAGYYRFPTIYQAQIVFVAEDDLWAVSRTGGMARRLTSNLGHVTYPMFSPDGAWLAFVGYEEGHAEVYVMPSQGGVARRLTYQASDCRIVGWDAEGTHILYCSNYGQPHSAEYVLYQIAADSRNGLAEPLPYGPARTLSIGPNGGMVLGRNTGDPARWKRYRGGTAGQLWIDRAGNGDFVRFLPDLAGNIAAPLWIASNDRIYFISDHEGIGNLYSVHPDGADLQRHTDHEDYYARNPSTDGSQIVYHAGADLYVFDIAQNRGQRVDVDYYSPRVQRSRKFVYSGHYVDSASLNPRGNAVALTTRGKAFSFHNHEGAVIQLGQPNGVRYQLADWLNDGQRVVLISDAPGEEVLEIHSRQPGVPVRRLADIEFGRALDLRVSPTADQVALTNHRHELFVVDLESEQITFVDRSPYRAIAGVDWSPDGRWLVYGFGVTHQTTELRLYRLPDPEAEDDTLREGSIHRISRPVLHDVGPVFDPEGNYIYFISHREFNPVADNLHFDLGFPRGTRPYLITLRADLPNPFVLQPDDEDDEREEDEADDEADDEERDESDEGEVEYQHAMQSRPMRKRMTEGRQDPAPGASPADDEGGSAEDDDEKPAKIPHLQIDLDGIEGRILGFPVPEGRYGQIGGMPEKAIFTLFPVEGSLGEEDESMGEEDRNGQLRVYNFKEHRAETLADEVDWFDLSRNTKKLIYGSGDRLRVVAAGEKAPGNEGSPRKSGWIDLGRVKVSIDPQSEWEQMFREAWRLQRDHFWTEDMSDVNWQMVYERYFPLIARVSSRGEFSDLMWEMQGELGTSHAYEFGGDYRLRPLYSQGFLGATVRWDDEAEGYRLLDFVRGDPWNADAHSPLAAPGVNIREGDLLVAINGQALDRQTGPAQWLVNQAGEEVMLTVRREEPTADDRPQTADELPRDTHHLHTVTVRTLYDERAARYRAWVNGNRARVDEATGGRVGYVHIPDMGPEGYAEFHRGYLSEIDKDALIVDVRYNGGGNVSSLILEKLAKRRLGYDMHRWGGLSPYPEESVAGPLVALTNEQAGSDGDIFCHSFKMMGLGPLIGKRTWGGVVGIWPRHALVDGTVTTQPEFSHWFADAGWNVENYGTDPDLDVDNTPQDYRAGRDVQLERAVETIRGLLQSNPPLQPPDRSSRPSRALPKLPKREE